MDEHKDILDKQNGRFITLFAQSQSALFSYILSLLPNWTEAEDVLQQTSLVLWEKFDSFDPESDKEDFTRWACQIAKYHVLNRLKKLSRDRHVFSDALVDLLAEEGIEDITLLDAKRRALGSCLDGLQTRHRQLIQARYSGLWSIKDLAQTWGCTPNSLYRRLNRLRRLLFQCIQQVLAEGGHL